jgi:serine/threonine protein kinase/tetratricopeptide (TPR) repeat protein
MPADPRRIKELFAAALDLRDEQARQSMLDRECAGDDELRHRLEALLRVHGQPHPDLDRPLAVVAPAHEQPVVTTDSPAALAQEQSGTVLASKYKLIERIGEGGMGSVWMAQQHEPVKRMVAVKLIKSGDDSSAVLARFEAERQALAMMDHPNIARVLDGGTTESAKPFFVMELVKGTPITQFCDTRKLTPKQRLELFVPVCQAIQHAHQKGIIHRDIKPSNVLVALYDDRPMPKVIDFGVAKAAGAQLTDRSLHTGFGALVGTPQYMSPEQATLNNLDIDTRSDIYSLGVLLYELMTGSPPFGQTDLKKAGMLEVLRVIREEEPPRPSTKISTAEALPSLAANRGTEPAKLTRQVRGEIDWIVMKALEKDRGRRYETANGFAFDIQRFLADEPVVAGPPSAAYRARKFVKRHKGQVVAALAVLLVLLGGIAGTSWGLVRANLAWQSEEKQRRIAEEKQQEAEEQKKRAQQAEKETLEDYRASTDDAIEQLIGSKSTLGPQEKAYLQKTLKRWQVFAGRSGDDERSREIRAEGIFRVAQLRFKLGQTEAALAGFCEALALFQKLADESPGDPERSANLGSTHNSLAILMTDLNRAAEAVEHCLKAQAIYQKLADEFPGKSLYTSRLASTHNNLGFLLKKQKQVQKAAEHYLKALRLEEKLAGNSPDVLEYRHHLASSHTNLGLLLAEQDRPAKAIEQYTRALAIQKQVAGESPVTPAYRNELARTHVNMGIVLARQNHWEKATEHFRAALAIRQKLADDLPAVPEYREELARNLGNFAVLLADQSKSEKAAEQYRKALAIAQRLVHDFPAAPEYRRLLSVCHHDLGLLLARKNQTEQAAEHYRTALAIDQELADKFPTMPEYRKGLAGTYASLGYLLSDQNQGEKAVDYYQKALNLQQKLAAEFPGEPEYRQLLARMHHNLGFLLGSLNQRGKGADHFNKALAIQQKLADELPDIPLYRSELAGTHSKLATLFQGQNQVVKAAEHYRKALAIQDKLVRGFTDVAKYRLELARTHNNLALMLVAQLQPGKAVQQYQKSLALLQKLAEDFPNLPEYRNAVGTTHNNWGELLRTLNQQKEAAERFEKALTIRQKLAEDYPEVPDYRSSLAATYISLGLLSADQKQMDRSRMQYQKALAIQQKLAEEYPTVPAYQVSLGGSFCNFGNLMRACGKPADSLPWYEKAIATLTRVHQQDRQVVTPRLFLRNTHWGRAQAHHQLEKYAEAVKDWIWVIKLCPPQQQPLFRLYRANSLVRAGEVAEAIAEVAELSKIPTVGADEWYNFACIYALAGSKAAAKRREYADQAMKMLLRAVQGGFTDAAHMTKDMDLDSLRQRADFKKLLESLAKPNEKGPAGK